MMIPALRERRRHDRQVIQRRLYVALNASSSGGISNDLSEGGMSLELIGPPLAGNDVFLSFDLAEMGQRFEAKGRIAWSIERENQNRVGLKFTEVSEDSRYHLKRWLGKKVVVPQAPQDVAAQDRVRSVAPGQKSATEVGPIGSASDLAARSFAVPSFGDSASRSADRIITTAPEPRSGGASIAQPKAQNGNGASTVAQPQSSNGASTVTQPQSSNGASTVTQPQSSNGASTVTQPQSSNGASTVTQPQSSVLEKEPGDLRANALRTSFQRAQAAPVVIPPVETKPFNPELLRRWLFAAFAAFVLLVALAGARWVYTSPALNDVTPETLRKMIGNVLNPPTDKYGADKILQNIPNAAKLASRPRRKKRVTDHQEPANGSNAVVQIPRSERFQVMNAQNVITVFPGYGSSESLPLVRSVSAPSEPFVTPIAGFGVWTPTPESRDTKVGLVSVNPSPEVPQKKVLPEYPALALEKNIQGRVVLRAIIGKDGALQNVALAQEPSLLSEAVLEAVKKWRYQPRYQHGVPVEVDTQITIDFEINVR
jgi:TonB family protein